MEYKTSLQHFLKPLHHVTSTNLFKKQHVEQQSYLQQPESQQVQHDNSTPTECAGCKLPIVDRFLLKSLDKFWHEDCLKCSCCQCRLAELGSTLFSRENLILCRRDYLRLFGSPGYCSVCEKSIPAFEMVMKAKHNVYHLECFACQQCNHRFCVGDRYYLCDNKILCEYDYEERLIFAKMSLNYESLNKIKQDSFSMGSDVIAGLHSMSS